jgi:hypothetical protein
LKNFLSGAKKHEGIKCENWLIVEKGDRKNGKCQFKSFMIIIASITFAIPKCIMKKFSYYFPDLIKKMD